ncbi:MULTISPECIES: ATP-binding protein [Pseudomonas]|uniref:ATP-binding protein n=1 Tax=Pseudomonas TaxID=286 RepID=UPI00398FCBB2
MTGAVSVRRQIVLSLSFMVLGVILLTMVGTYVFYAIALTLSPDSISESWIPSKVEMLWIVGTTILALCLAGFVAIRLSRRILTPLNSVAHSLREIAQGNLQARAVPDDQALGETGQLVRDFNAMAERLQSVTREQQFWNAAVAHELRTPVTILRGRLQGLAEGVFPPSTKIFEGLLRQIEGLGRLIEDLRVVSLSDSHHLNLDLSLTEVTHEVSVTVHALTESLQLRGFKLRIEVGEQIHTVCDAFRLRQALSALLENALHHADPGVLIIRTLTNNGLFTLSVEDSGPGISPNLAPYVFEAFRRGEPSTSGKSGGSGLGLAVVKAIAEAHGGNAICVPSANGTRFEIQLPIQGPASLGVKER